MEPGRLDLAIDASLLAASTGHLAECPDLGPACAGPAPPVPYYHHVDLVMSDVALDASYGVTDWLAAELRLTLRVVDITPTYSELDGAPKLVPHDIHHHDRTIAGPTDPWVSLRFGGALGKLTTAARLGVTLPIGGTEPDPYRLGARGAWHEHTQLGTGTFVPMVGVGLAYALDPVELAATGLAQLSLYENEHGFRAPSRYFVNVRATVPVLGGKLRPYLEASLPHETEELWGGLPGLEGSNARTDLLLGGGVAWELAAPWQIALGARARVAKFAEGATLDYPGIVQVRVSTHFGGDTP